MCARRTGSRRAPPGFSHLTLENRVASDMRMTGVLLCSEDNEVAQLTAIRWIGLLKFGYFIDYPDYSAVRQEQTHPKTETPAARDKSARSRQSFWSRDRCLSTQFY